MASGSKTCPRSAPGHALTIPCPARMSAYAARADIRSTSQMCQLRTFTDGRQNKATTGRHVGLMFITSRQDLCVRGEIEGLRSEQEPCTDPRLTTISFSH